MSVAPDPVCGAPSYAHKKGFISPLTYPENFRSPAHLEAEI